MDPHSQDQQCWMSTPEPEPEPGLVGSGFLAEHGLCDDELHIAVDTSNIGPCDPESNLLDTNVPLADLTKSLTPPLLLPTLSPSSDFFASELSITSPITTQISHGLGPGTCSNGDRPDLAAQRQRPVGSRDPINMSDVVTSPRSHAAVQLQRKYIPRQASGLRSEYQLEMSTNTPSPKIQSYEHQHKFNPATLSHQSYHNQEQGIRPIPHNHSQAFQEGIIRSSNGEQVGRSFTQSLRPIWHSSTSSNCQQYPQHSMAHSPQVNNVIHGLPQSSDHSMAGILSQHDESQICTSNFDLPQSTHAGAPNIGKRPSSSHNNTLTANMDILSSSGNKKRPASSSMYQEASSPSSRKPRVKQEHGNSLMSSLAADPQASQVFGSPHRGQNDDTLVALLVDSMNALDATEDNHGMLSTWRKLMVIKADKIQRVCEELLETIKKSHAMNGQPLGEKRAVNHYTTFGSRFTAVCEALKTQKTVCKHLLEDPYAYQVVDDPIFALRRVQNNRRVNGQKKEAIDKGRKLLGQKGQVKGRRSRKLKRDFSTDESGDLDNSADDPSEGEDFDMPVAIPKPKAAARRCKKSKKTRNLSPEDDIEYTMDNPPPPKKTKRERRSKYQVVNGSMVDTTEPSSYLPNEDRHTYGKLAQESGVQGPAIGNDSQQFQDFGQPLNHYFDQHAYGPTAPRLPTYDAHFFDQNHSQELQYSNAPVIYSSGTDQYYSDPYSVDVETGERGQFSYVDHDFNAFAHCSPP